MSYYDYHVSLVIAANDYPFYALIMAAMRKADSGNAELLRVAFPDTFHELKLRYNLPGGVLPEEEPKDG